MKLTNEQFDDMVLHGKVLCLKCGIESDGVAELRSGLCPWCKSHKVCGPVTLLEIKLVELKRKAK